MDRSWGTLRGEGFRAAFALRIGGMVALAFASDELNVVSMVLMRMREQ